MNYMLCKQSVTNFDEFKRTLGSHDAAHKESGFTVKRIWQDIYDPTVVFFLCEVWDVTKAKGFVEREIVRMKKEGVTEFPDIFYLSER